MKKQIAADLMPPVFEVVAKPPVKPLDPKNKKVLLDWLESGAKKSNESCEDS